MASFILTINGRRERIEADPDMPLLWVLRDSLHLTGTKYGCGVGACGACTVHENSAAVRSCQIPMSRAAGKSYTTIEGLSADASHPCQRAWVTEDVAQCGYCQPGMIMAAAALLKLKPNPSAAEIDHAMARQLCRCGTYNRVRRAIQQAALERSRS
jgi:aerobic-type carbon monoxide dehydrogenase small subunit (CoxS/CutS family)